MARIKPYCDHLNTKLGSFVFWSLKGGIEQLWHPTCGQNSSFFDEATAMAAGHRPCFECRRAAANLFKLSWLRGNPEFGFDQKTLIGKIDEVLQKERINENGEKVTFEAELQDLPGGAFIEIEGQACLFANGMVYLWSAFGYADGQQLSLTTKVKVLTPRSMVNAIRVGYPVQMGLIND